MTYRNVVRWPNKSVLKSCAEVDNFDEKLNALVIDMIDTCNVDLGIGLAANQIGVSKRVVVIKPSAFGFDNGDPHDYNSEFMVLVNPVLKNAGDMINWKEACLSVPGVEGTVSRHSETVVEYQTVNGESKSLIAEWPLSGGLQHECDHLDGKLFISRMSRGSRHLAISKYVKEEKKKARAEKREAAKNMPKPTIKSKRKRKKARKR